MNSWNRAVLTLASRGRERRLEDSMSQEMSLRKLGLATASM